ncbi:MAG: hypothetical protein BWY08_01427 [Bacteroidetes bacterium ADurb.Bin174]|nr:MAG: hypothetical protein BWY08_01427 [Bacteroidetes bacterium ADurb.Bin174]
MFALSIAIKFLLIISEISLCACSGLLQSILVLKSSLKALKIFTTNEIGVLVLFDKVRTNSK